MNKPTMPVSSISHPIPLLDRKQVLDYQTYAQNQKPLEDH